jgi:hypothetical protein
VSAGSCHHSGGFGTSLSCRLCLAELAAVVPRERGRPGAPRRRLHAVPDNPGPEYEPGPAGDSRWPEEARRYLEERRRPWDRDPSGGPHGAA